MIKNKHIFLFAFLTLSFQSCKKEKKEVSEEVKLDYSVINIFPHNINSFTEGLFIDSNNNIYESTGSPEDMPNTESVYGILNLKTGNIDVKSKLDKSIYFGEGIALCDNKIFQLTYKNKIGFIYDSGNHSKLGSFSFLNNEGWGLSNIDDSTLVMSDGTNVLTFFDSKTFKVHRKLEVNEKNIPIYNLNELECVGKFIYANIFTTNYIVKINIDNGEVVKRYDFSDLYNRSRQGYSNLMEMNGIAYNSQTQNFLLTGKMWPYIYEVKLKD